MIAFIRLIPWWLWGAIIASAAFGYLLVSLENAESALIEESAALEQEQAKSASLTKTLTLQRDLYRDTQAVNDAYNTKTQAIQAENDRLADQLARGGELHFNATCVPAARNATAQPSPDDPRPRLDAAAQRDYLNLRAGLQRQAEQIAGLQTYIQTICLRGRTQ